MLIIIDNSDGSVANLYQHFGLLGQEVQVVPNTVTTEEIEKLCPDRIIVSSGFCLPQNLCEVIRNCGIKVPLLGVCLGNQLIGLSFGAKLERCKVPVFNSVVSVHHDGKGVLADMPNPFWAGCSFSHIISREGKPDCLEISAWTEDGMIMGLRHCEYPIEGIQFHTNPITVDIGKTITKSFIADKG